MPFDRNRTGAYLKDFSFKALFLEILGWDQLVQRLDVSIDSKTYPLVAIAHKRGMVAFECQLQDAEFPPYPIRRKIDQEVTKNVREHLIVYTDTAKTHQVWQWVKREPGRPTACREYSFHKGQSGEGLIQKLEAIKFSLDEEESLTLVDVTGRTRGAFDVEKITKKFYDRFKIEHDGFLKFIKGIPDGELHRWYASVLMNRLMFIYFIQKKSFLDNNVDYLRAKLAHSKERGKDKFYSDVLCPLFFDGFAKKEADRSQTMNKLLGKVPYLNGGLFLKHQIEELHGKEIRIVDAAFEKIFEFFEQYQWHLDERQLKEGNEINPDVLGYIFEKYINQKQMGAYYTKEDITEYISKNTVIPYLFDAAKQKCKIAFEGESTSRRHSGLDPESRDSSSDSTIWKLLQLDPDQYIYDAVKKGVELPLPEEIAKGLNDVSRRTEWNKAAREEYALPTEIWREVVARRKRYEEVRSKLANGEVRDINDLITYNLNIRQFAHDVIENSEGPELLRAFYHAIEKVTVLDPTCGSGAFLFAALNILEPLYEACLDRMEVFLCELERSGEKHRPEKYSDFKKILEQVEKHPNRKYFIFKSIIVNNLYGVDIMEEAIEICKLRLFLKLVAQVGAAAKIEPLPDIDFNIRAGNTLVGYATYDELKKSMESDWVSAQSLPTIEEKAQDVARLFKLFHHQQTELDGEITVDSKHELRKRLKKLEDELNSHLAKEYGINPDKKIKYEKWSDSHKPFNWFIEFYGILNKGGFDVVIGNPPYVELSKIKNEYGIVGYYTMPTGNLYCAIFERSLKLLRQNGHIGLIVPLSLSCTERMKEMRQVLERECNTVWISHFSGDANPSVLFDGAKIRLDIVVGQHGGVQNRTFSSSYLKWFYDERPYLFPLLTYTEVFPTSRHLGLIPKYGETISRSVIAKVLSKRPMGLCFGGNSRAIYIHRVMTLFIKCFDFVPYFSNELDGVKKSDDYKPFTFKGEGYATAALAIYNSTTFFYYFVVFGDCFHCGKEFVTNFPLDIEKMDRAMLQKLSNLGESLMIDLKKNSVRRSTVSQQTGKVKYDEFWPRYSKPIIDEIDRVLAKHYGLTDEELDFIINYDIKYRMGRDSNERDVDD